MNRNKFFSAVVILVTFLSTFAYSFPAKAAEASDISSAVWCGNLSVYTTWKGIKPILYVWKGKDKQNPKYVSVYFDSEYVSNTDNGIRVDSPQVDTKDGWVGYYISKRWALQHPKWDDDSRWQVRACIP